MSFCSSRNTTTITSLATANNTYSNSVIPQTSTLARITDGTNKGRLTQEALAGIYASLVAKGSLKGKVENIGNTTTNTTRNAQQNYDNLSTIGKTELETVQSLGNEYCFYYVRYKYVLETLFDKLMTTSAQSEVSTADRNTITDYLNAAKTINSKLNDLIQITNYISKQRGMDLQDQNSSINQLNTSISSNFNALKKQNEMLQKETSIADLRKSMVEYSQEKNLSAQNLLSLYGFLNLVALGLLFYIARS